MSTEFSLLDDEKVILITVQGHISAAEVGKMRKQTMEVADETGFNLFIMDISSLLSIERGSTFAAYDLGDQFRETGFEFQTKTAVIMPKDPVAREQAEFMHTVEINRGRGALKYVESVDEAVAWFKSRPRVRNPDA